MISNKSTEYGSSKGILAYPDHYVAMPVTIPSTFAGAVTENGRKYVKAGTIYPANDATAQGVIMSDVDLTYGDGATAVIIHGFIKKASLPVVPAAAAITALKNITFLPFV